MTTNEKQQTANKITRNVAAHLRAMDEQLWQTQDCEMRGTRLFDGNGREIYLRIDSYQNPNRVEVSGSYPASEDGTRYWPSDIWEDGEKLAGPEITVATDRGAEVIAREILRRFYPRYIEIWVQLFRRAAARNKAQRRGREIGDLMQGALGADRMDDNGQSGYRYDDGPRAEFKVWGSADDPHVDLELKNLPPSLAGKIANLYRDHIDAS